GGSGDRGGWAPVSPPKQDGLQFVDEESEDEDTFHEMDDRLRPRRMPFSDEATSIFDEPPPEDGGRRLADASPVAAEKHAREGRDFTSTEAFAAGSLDL
ncbi:unnamed protein product, partial [Ascophyllum nodosum]